MNEIPTPSGILGGTSGATRKAPDASDEWRRTPGRKNRARWCGGHPGREHEPQTVRSHRYPYPCHESNARTWEGDTIRVWRCRHVTTCTRCGKILDEETSCPEKPDGVPYDWWKRALNTGENPVGARASLESTTAEPQ